MHFILIFTYVIQIEQLKTKLEAKEGRIAKIVTELAKIRVCAILDFAMCSVTCLFIFLQDEWEGKLSELVTVISTRFTEAFDRMCF